MCIIMTYECCDCEVGGALSRGGCEQLNQCFYLLTQFKGRCVDLQKFPVILVIPVIFVIPVILWISAPSVHICVYKAPYLFILYFLVVQQQDQPQPLRVNSPNSGYDDLVQRPEQEAADDLLILYFHYWVRMKAVLLNLALIGLNLQGFGSWL